MIKVKHILSLLVILILSIQSHGQAVSDSTICLIKGDKIVFYLKRDWDDDKRAEVSSQYAVDSLAMAIVLSDSVVTEINFSNENWIVTYPDANSVTLWKNMSKMNGSWSGKADILIFPLNGRKFKSGPGYVDQSQVTFGVNDLKDEVITQYKDGRVKFALKNYGKAHKVVLAGSFNGWDEEMQMSQVGNQWEIEVKLEPGKYLYKFIVDGQWIDDPANKLGEGDGYGEMNSVMYVYNYEFSLKGKADAGKVYLAGTFNNWREKELRMSKTAAGWNIPVFIKDGTYAYKFIVDNKWTTDPENPRKADDGQNGFNSIIGIGKPYVFELEGFENASNVVLSGSFNNWNELELVMTKTQNGWRIPHVLTDGNYEYRFIVDGEWVNDPANPYLVDNGYSQNNFIAIGANHSFVYPATDNPHSVIVTGSFNGWNETNYKMYLTDNQYIFPLYLSPGKHLYKFLVDGAWQRDDANSLYEHNEYGSENSILWVK